MTRYLIRDPDSRLTKRDRLCVQEWLDASGSGTDVPFDGDTDTSNAGTNSNNEADMDKSQLDNGGDAALLVHSIRDHFYHTIPIMGAMWGAVGGVIRGYFDIGFFQCAIISLLRAQGTAGRIPAQTDHIQRRPSVPERAGAIYFF